MSGRDGHFTALSLESSSTHRRANFADLSGPMWSQAVEPQAPAGFGLSIALPVDGGMSGLCSVSWSLLC